MKIYDSPEDNSTYLLDVDGHIYERNSADFKIETLQPELIKVSHTYNKKGDKTSSVYGKFNISDNSEIRAFSYFGATNIHSAVEVSILSYAELHAVPDNGNPLIVFDRNGSDPYSQETGPRIIDANLLSHLNQAPIEIVVLVSDQYLTDITSPPMMPIKKITLSVECNCRFNLFTKPLWNNSEIDDLEYFDRGYIAKIVTPSTGLKYYMPHLDNIERPTTGEGRVGTSSFKLSCEFSDGTILSFKF